MGRGSGSIRPHLAVLLLLTGVLAGLLLRTAAPSVPTPLPQGEAGERIAAALPAELSPLRRAFVESGAALVGRVGYFWGGKSDAVGWDARWGVPAVVTAPGSSTSGESLPFGLDCSGFVSWALTQSGVCNTGRLGAQGLYNISTPVSSANARPGDLIFFVGTYDTPGVSHVGIYVGGGKMLHCGDPIQYADINTSYWQSHFYAFGRPPYN